jgi:hypothetical protein
MSFEIIFRGKFFRRSLVILLGISVGLFIFFYPILSGILTPIEIRERWFWFPGWL